MGLTQRLADWGATRTAVLVAEVPGWGRTRCAVEREVRRRGWRLATSPADADALVVCGQPGPRLTAAVELLWGQLPGPRARTAVVAAPAVRSALDQLHAGLVDTGHQRRDAGARPVEPSQGIPATGTKEGSDRRGSADEASGDEPTDGRSDGSERSNGDRPPGDSEDGPPGHDAAGDSSGSGHEQSHHHQDMGDQDMDDQDMDDMDMDDMDMDDMDMPMPGGIPLASGGDDRDGLNLDVLHVPLGPVLPAWPAGLLVHCTLQGDVVTDAHVEVLAPAVPAPVEEDLVHGCPADLLDRTARVLTVAGWLDAASAAARLRDDLLDADDPRPLATEVQRLERRVRRSRLLRWSLRGRGQGDEGGGTSSGDGYQRLLRLLADARSGLDGRSTPVHPTPIDRLPDLLIGRQLAAVRLVMAAVDVDVTALVHAGVARA